MQHADTLTVVHHDDSQSRYRNVHYALDRHGIRIRTTKGEHAFTDVLTTHAYRRRAPRRRTKAQVAA
jgi:hypothetical protein